jgi:hypothetical protein
MRKVLLITLVGLISSGVCFAENYQHKSDKNQRRYATYLNVGIGSGSTKVEFGEGFTSKNSGLPFGISVGMYDRENLFGAEFSFVKLRELKLSLVGTELAVLSESDVMLSGLYHLRINPTLAANVFAGFNRTTISAGISAQHSANGIHYGVSAAYTINPNMAIFAKVFRLDTVTIKNPLTENSENFKARDVILLGVQAEF